MTTERLQVKNVKCAGCATRITERLTQLTGVDVVEVDVATGVVSVSGEGFSLDALATELTQLGYPLV